MPDLPAVEPALELHLDPHPGASSEALVRGVTHRRFLGEYADPERAAKAGRAWAERVLPRARGAHALGLNVFGYNLGAKALYDRLGYHVVEEFAAHTIEPRP